MTQLRKLKALIENVLSGGSRFYTTDGRFSNLNYYSWENCVKKQIWNLHSLLYKIDYLFSSTSVILYSPLPSILRRPILQAGLSCFIR